MLQNVWQCCGDVLVHSACAAAETVSSSMATTIPRSSLGWGEVRLNHKPPQYPKFVPFV